jgi:hypothetical protein
MNHNGVLDYFGGTDNMSIFGSPDPIAEQFVVGSQEYQDAGMALDRQRGIGQVAKEQHPETQEIFDMLPARQPVISAQMLKNYIKSGHSKNISEFITGTPGDNIRKDIPEAKRGGKESSIFSDIGDWLGDKENMARLGIGLNSLRLNPDAAFAASLQKSIDSLQKSKASKAKATQAVASLLKLGRTDLATAVSEGVMDPGDAIKLAFKKEKVSARDKNIALFESDPERFATLKENSVIGGGGTTINLGGDAYDKEASKGFAAFDEKIVNLATSAPGIVKKAKDVQELLKSGAINTGWLSELKQGVDKVAASLGGKDALLRLSNTELLSALTGSDVFPMIKQLGIGARGLDTPAEREFLLAVMVGTATMTTETLYEMAQRRIDTAELNISKYNSYLKDGKLDKFQKNRGYSFQPISTTGVVNWSDM